MFCAQLWNGEQLHGIILFQFWRGLGLRVHAWFLGGHVICVSIFHIVPFTRSLPSADIPVLFQLGVSYANTMHICNACQCLV